jgi:hypothetical protein
MAIAIGIVNPIGITERSIDAVIPSVRIASNHFIATPIDVVPIGAIVSPIIPVASSDHDLYPISPWVWVVVDPDFSSFGWQCTQNR